MATLATIFAGCSTKRYGRLENISQKEAQLLTCREIEIEVDKAQTFIKRVKNKDNEFTKEDVLGFLGDLGIGNRMEVSEALESAQNRLNDLYKLQAQKGCN